MRKPVPLLLFILAALALGGMARCHRESVHVTNFPKSAVAASDRLYDSRM